MPIHFPSPDITNTYRITPTSPHLYGKIDTRHWITLDNSTTTKKVNDGWYKYFKRENKILNKFCKIPKKKETKVNLFIYSVI